jgi:hypothetical protein
MAANYLRAHGWDAQIREVLGWDEIALRKPSPYTAQPIHLAEAWICYVRLEAMQLGSSEIVIVSRETGDVVYAGSASDEG